jgi:hypothetical protein
MKDIVGEILSGQIGTDTELLALGKYDMRRLTNLPQGLLMVMLYAEIRSKSSETWAVILDSLVNYLVGVGGRGRRDLLRGMQVSHGGSMNVEAEIESKRPDAWTARNLTHRGWKDDAKREMGEP